MIKLKKYKNPSPEIYRLLNKLLDNKVLIRYRNNNLYFQVIGNLEKTKYHNIFKVSFSETNKLNFNRIDIDKILDDYVIELSTLKLNSLKNLENNFSTLKIKKELDNLKEAKITKIFLNYPFSEINEENSIISGKLKYNKPDDLYYISNKDFKSFIEFNIKDVDYINIDREYIVLNIGR